MSEGAAPHVLMVVANDVATDSRVKKSALALARGGLQVTILGLTVGGRREEAMLGPCRIIRVPVRYWMRDARLRRRRDRRRWVPPVGYRDPKVPAALKLRITARERDVIAAAGRAVARREAAGGRPSARVSYAVGVAGRRMRRLTLKARRKTVDVRQRVEQRISQRSQEAWTRYDTTIGRYGAAARWRRIAPDIDDLEVSFGPVIDEVAPDVIHAHDFHVVGIASRAAARLRARGRPVRWIYDAHEYVVGMSEYGTRTPRVVAAYADLEREYIRDADRVITVSWAIADELARNYSLPRRPTVVMNIPIIRRGDPGEAPSLRDAAGVGPDTPLLVYSGGVTPARGVRGLVEALPLLPGVHLALVAIPAKITRHVQELLDAAADLGVGDRLHLVAPVASDQVVAYLSGADIGVHPMLHFGSHDLALPNKLFEYAHAGIPVVVSDCRVMADFVRRADIGRVFPAGDPAALADAVRMVFDDVESYRKRLRDPGLLEAYTWGGEERHLRDLYRDLLGDVVLPEDEVGSPATALAETPALPTSRQHSVVLGIGPANMAGQAWAWAKACERASDHVTTEVVAVARGTLNFPADVLVPPRSYARSVGWQLARLREAEHRYTHVLVESGRPFLGYLHGKALRDDVAALERAGVEVGLVFHGSDVRDPRRHRGRYPYSPFADPQAPLTRVLQRQVEQLAPYVRDFSGPKFVSTPDLLDDVPDAVWLPVVVDTEVWRPGPKPLQRPRPLVVHAPSNRALKGTERIEPVLQRLVDRGLIEYRRIEGVPPEQMPAALSEADIVLDHFGIGNYGVLTCQAMASGRVTVSHVHERVRARVPIPLPVVEATPDDLDTVLERLLDDRDAARELAAEGPAFVKELHDGAHSAEVLAPFLGLPLPAARTAVIT